MQQAAKSAETHPTSQSQPKSPLLLGQQELIYLRKIIVSALIIAALVLAKRAGI